MKYAGNCHCGDVAFEVPGNIDEVQDCNCSMCRRRGGLLWFAPRESLTLTSPEGAISSYTFNKNHIEHRFYARCGIAPFSEGTHPATGARNVAVNVRCLPDVDLSALTRVMVHGAAL